MHTYVNADLLPITQAQNVTFHFGTLKGVLGESCQRCHLLRKRPEAISTITATHLRHMCEPGSWLQEPQIYKHYLVGFKLFQNKFIVHYPKAIPLI